MEFILVFLIIVISEYWLRKLFLGKGREKEDIWKDIAEAGLDIRMYGLFTILVAGFVSYLIISILNGWDSFTANTFFLIFVIIFYGFKLFIDWKYKKDKSYAVTSIVLVMGVILFSSLLIIK